MPTVYMLVRPGSVTSEAGVHADPHPGKEEKGKGGKGQRDGMKNNAVGTIYVERT